jgi:hypothetical protein
MFKKALLLALLILSVHAGQNPGLYALLGEKLYHAAGHVDGVWTKH